MESFFKLRRPDEVLKLMERFGPCGEEEIPLEEAFNRALSHPVISPEDLPGFSRSTMDGYAVRAKDTFGAGESLPALFEITGEVSMGESPSETIGQGQAVRISTGGMLPEGADGVVMVEFCHALDRETLEVSRAISPLENVIQPGDDIRKHSQVLPAGHRLRPQDMGVLAGLGLAGIRVYRRPRIAIISTGDELVSLDMQPAKGQVRDINRYSLGAFCLKAGGVPLFLGICPDDFESLGAFVRKGLEMADGVWLSGGSSVGTRDLTLKVLETLDDFELMVHGISISPGKPTIIARSGSIPLVGLPGHVASALVVAEVFMGPLIARLSGLADPGLDRGGRVEARLNPRAAGKTISESGSSGRKIR
jgi:molybdopterin molybdotransferase